MLSDLPSLDCWYWWRMSYHHQTNQKFCWCRPSTHGFPAFEWWHLRTNRSRSRSCIINEVLYPSFSNSAIMLKIVGFFESKPKLYIAAFNSRGSTFPVPSVSKRLKASLISSISSSVSPGLNACKMFTHLSWTFFWGF